jgi:alkyl sulfatase BDS1-like metallo-beta-lactamase superfamily hydrolase
VHHNARAVYVKYLGYFDGNPAHLYPLTPVEIATRYLEFMDGADAIVAKAKKSFEAGDYRWVAEVLNHVVMAQPDHFSGRALLADTLEQLGYQSESAPWRNFYLCGALELREGLPSGSSFGASEGMARGIPLYNLFQTMAVRLNGARADGITLNINIDFKDGDQTLLTIENSVLHAFEGKQHESPTATMKINEIDYKRLMMGLADAGQLLESGALEVEGDITALAQLAGLFDQFDRRFPIVTPRKPWK